MFPALSTPYQCIWLGGLLVLWAGLLFGGFVAGELNADRRGRSPRWTRMASSVVLAAAGWSWWLVSRGTTTSIFALLIAAGMTLGLLGDLFLGGLLPVAQPTLWGMGAFGLGHVAYIAGGIVYGNSHGLAAFGPRFGAWAAWLALGLVGWAFVVFRGGKPTFLHWIALPYALLLASTAGIASGLALQDIALWTMAAGAALFLLSDLVIAARLFNPQGTFGSQKHFYLIDNAIWLTYGPAQMLIVYSVAGALRMTQ